MNTKFLNAFIGVAGLACTASALQAQSINVSVIGTITPAACIPMLAGGGVVDYGDIPASTLNMSTFNVLPEKAVVFNVNCAAPTRIAISTVDNRASSVVPGAVSAILPGLSDAYNFGLGTVAGANVGGYTMVIASDTFTIDGNAMVSLQSLNGGAVWFASSTMLINNPSHLYSWGLSALTGPQSGMIFAGTLNVQAVLNKGAALPLTAAVPLDGSATMSIIYL